MPQLDIFTYSYLVFDLFIFYFCLYFILSGFLLPLLKSRLCFHLFLKSFSDLI